MFQVRSVRVEDAKLIAVGHPADPARGELSEGLLIKAETPPRGMNNVTARRMSDWASLHAHLEIDDTVGPGKELMLALMSRPRSNVFNGAVGALAAQGRVVLPDGDFRHFVIRATDGSDEIEIRFYRDEAEKFVATLIHNWFDRAADNRVISATDE